jgi:hypothetical protein
MNDCLIPNEQLFCLIPNEQLFSYIIVLSQHFSRDDNVDDGRFDPHQHIELDICNASSF